MQRQCARPGCSAVAVATFTFDARRKTVWLDEPREGGARAGELCSRHAQRLTPPQGWRLDDRRGKDPETIALEEMLAAPEPEPAPTAAPEPALAPQPAPAPAPVDNAVPELRILLDAHTPLLSRAFQAAGTV